MKIQPISSWQNGQEKQGTIFNLSIVNDNLSTSATFYYTISSEEVSHMETRVITPATEDTEEVTIEVKVVDAPSEILVQGNLSISGADYQEWDADPSANAFAYNYAANKLNLVIIGD